MRGWSTSEELRGNDTTIIIFVDTRYIFPTEVWSRMKIINPPKSTWDERKNLIKKQQSEKEIRKNLKHILNDKEIDNAVRLTAGMNLDQLEASLI